MKIDSPCDFHNPWLMFSQGPLGREGENGIPGVDGLPVCVFQI